MRAAGMLSTVSKREVEPRVPELLGVRLPVLVLQAGTLQAPPQPSPGR